MNALRIATRKQQVPRKFIPLAIEIGQGIESFLKPVTVFCHGLTLFQQINSILLHRRLTGKIPRNLSLEQIRDFFRAPGLFQQVRGIRQILDDNRATIIKMLPALK